MFLARMQQYMNNFETNFLERTANEPCFEIDSAKDFLNFWFKNTVSIEPEFIDREEWESKVKEKAIIKKSEKNKKTVCLPNDLRLWEMAIVIETLNLSIDDNTQETTSENAKNIHELGETFRKAGLYISEYLPTLNEEAKKNAEDFANEFYKYGFSLMNKKRDENIEIPKDEKLSPEDKDRLDEWFLGEKAYQKRLDKLGENPTEDEKDNLRKKLISVYFNALSRKGYKSGENPMEIKIGPIKHLQDTTETQTIKAMKIPETEMISALFKKGLERLTPEMKTYGWKGAINGFLKVFGINPLLEQEKLYDAVNMDEMKKELEKARQSENNDEVSLVEVEIASKIQKALRRFPYETMANYPHTMIETQFINCVGATMIGGKLLDELGIEYVVADLGTHSSAVLITKNGKKYWMDFIASDLNVNKAEIKEDMIDEGFDFPEPEKIPDTGVTLKFKNWNPYRNIKGKLTVNLFPKETGTRLHVLNNTGYLFEKSGQYEKAIEAYNQAIKINPEYAPARKGLGDVYVKLEEYEKAIEEYDKAIKINPEYAPARKGLGDVYVKLEEYEKAIEEYNKAIKINPEYAPARKGLSKVLALSGKYRQAIVEFFKYVNSSLTTPL